MNARACRVFISHSANGVEEPATQRFLDALTARLEATPGLEPLVDQKDLQAGDEWLQRLYAWMGLSDAAIILLSPRAVLRENSTWVPRETNLLLWRKALDPRFVVIPVLIGGLTAADLAGNPFIADVRLTDLQLAAGLSEAEQMDKIVRALLDRLASGIAQLAFDPLRVHLEDCLQRFAPQASVDAALLAHYAADSWLPCVVAHQNLSLKMLRHAVADRVDPVIADVALGSLGEVQLGARLFEALYPMRLPAESACRLLTLCREQEGRGSVLVNTHDTWALRMLLRAATGLPKHDLLRKWQIVEMPGNWGDDDLNEVTCALAAELAEAVLGTNGWEELSDAADPAERLAQQMSRLVLQLKEARAETGVPILVCAAYTPRWIELAALLVDRFPSTVFVFWTGDALPAGVPEQLDCTPLKPSWIGGQDVDWRLGYRRKMKQFGGLAA